MLGLRPHLQLVRRRIRIMQPVQIGGLLLGEV